jgi:excinuclease ABC subunit C
LEDNLPDLLIIDGGAGQLSMALEAAESLNVKLDIIALAKIRAAKEEDKKSERDQVKEATFERIFVADEKQPILLEAGKPLTKLLQKIRDETHRQVINFHRRRRSKRFLTSSLSSIPGVGEVRARRLLREFSSLSEIASLGVEELSKRGKLPYRVAQSLLKSLEEKRGDK